MLIYILDEPDMQGHCWRSRDELISDVLLWTPTYGRAKAGRPARTYIQQLCEDTGCSPEDLPEAMNDREKWRERVRDICATSMTWWWWWIYIYIYGKIWRYVVNKQIWKNSKYSEDGFIYLFFVFVLFYGISTTRGHLMPLGFIYTWINVNTETFNIAK